MGSPSRYSRSSRRSRSRSRSRSPPSRYRRHSRSRSLPRRRQESPQRRSRSPPRRRDNNNRRQDNDRERNEERRGNRKYQWGRPEDNEEKEEEPIQKVEPNFGLSGKLAKETNTVNGVELKYNEPPEAAKPKAKWRLYVFKGDEQIDILHIHRLSSYLIGRDPAIADIRIDHPSCSKQHAVIQYRQVVDEDENGKQIKVVKPYLIDLEATNGTFINGEQAPATRFIELKQKDMLKFGNSTREYILLCAE